jgi:carbamoyltransferase
MNKVICGIKLTHDGGVALIDNQKLIFSYEMEKMNNNHRFSTISDSKEIKTILEKNGYSIDDVDCFAIDGWEGLDNILKNFQFTGFDIAEKSCDYNSYYHVTGHVLSAYCSSPFAKRNEGSYVLVWDGGMYPRLYYVDPVTKSVENFGKLFFLIGNIYSLFPLYFEPFRKERNNENVHLSIAGKVMAYIANGVVREDIVEDLTNVFNSQKESTIDSGAMIARDFIKATKTKNYKNEDVLASFHHWIERMIINSLNDKLKKYGRDHRNICFTGGCALNIKWNSAIKRSEIFNELWVPPFPNDSGSAIGVACAEMVTQSGVFDLDWSVYSGPELNSAKPLVGWKESECSISELATVLHEKQEPVVFLNGKAELGPRALGNRSIIASPTSNKMKEILNIAKRREVYRPIAPMCLEEYAEEIFEFGGEDRYMLYDYNLNPTWKNKLPAIMHIDGSARVQTVSADSNQIIYELLQCFKELSGVPVLTNTSANYNGSGFFPDVQSAMEWGRCNYIWSNNKLYQKQAR